MKKDTKLDMTIYSIGPQNTIIKCYQPSFYCVMRSARANIHTIYKINH